jgi:RHS repeat-associated protein
LNRLTTITYPTRTATYAYDPLNNLTRTTNENGSVYIGYDNRYRVSSFSDPFYYGITYNYDTAGNRTKLKLNGATYATYTYDAVNRLTNLADSENQSFPHSYDVVNRLTARSAPNGVTSNYAYDGLSRLTALTHMAGATTLIGNQYSYNDASNITSWTNASGNHAYGYDLVDRLTSATNSAQPNENYTYDGVGNRTASHLSASYSYQPLDKLTSTATGTYTYDNNGNLLSKTDSLGITTFSWNEENQLTQVGLPGALTVNYKYDGLGRRIQRTTSAGANERYVYDGNDALLDLNADWSVATTYLNGPGIDKHLRQTNSVTGVSYFLIDHLGSSAGLTDAAGNVVDQLAYDSFGNSTGSGRTRYSYTGRELDSDTGLYYYRARFYDPQTGRFISEDPIGLRGGINLYVYVKNNSISFFDPSGLTRCNPWLGALGGALLGAGVGGLAGEAAITAAGAVAGFAVGGPPGAILGAGAGAGSGLPLSVVTAAVGGGIGGYLGYRYCNDPCDTAPPAIPVPFRPPGPIPLVPPLGPNNPPRNPKKEEECWQRCQHLLPSPTGDRQASEFSKCYRECMGTL